MSARWTSEQLEKSSAKKANSAGRVRGSTGTGRQLVAVDITVNGQKETHYLFEGSRLLEYWQARAEENEKQ